MGMPPRTENPHDEEVISTIANWKRSNEATGRRRSGGRFAAVRRELHASLQRLQLVDFDRTGGVRMCFILVRENACILLGCGLSALAAEHGNRARNVTIQRM